MRAGGAKLFIRMDTQTERHDEADTRCVKRCKRASEQKQRSNLLFWVHPRSEISCFSRTVDTTGV
jgi:hypothetical protein